MNIKKQAIDLLSYLNDTYNRLHTEYEDLYWRYYMNMNEELGKAKNAAMEAKFTFITDSEIRNRVGAIRTLLIKDTTEFVQLGYWLKFFDCYQIPQHLMGLKKQIDDLQAVIEEKRNVATKGYIDPNSGDFVPVNSVFNLREIMVSSTDEKTRETCFDALEELSLIGLDEYVERIKLMNQFAKEMGFEDFYAYKVFVEEGMTKKELFDIFDDIYEQTKPVFQKMRDLEKEKPGLRKPWNFAHMMSGSFIAEEDPYYPMDQCLPRWGRTMMEMGVSYRGAHLTLDLVSRKNKHFNGFCHAPGLVKFIDKKRIPGRYNFTCNVTLGQIGSAKEAYDTCAHEGWHAADWAGSDQKQVCLNTEFPPRSTALSETSSMFCEDIMQSPEWKFRYAKDSAGNRYPFELYERKKRQTSVREPHEWHSIWQHSAFERAVYEEVNLTKERLLELAKESVRKYHDYSEDSHWFLNRIHLYTWDDACSYHGYGLAALAVEQLKEFFFNKYGFILDNSAIGEDMAVLWSYGSAKTFGELIEFATGKKLSAQPWLKQKNRDVEEVIAEYRQIYQQLDQFPESTEPIDMGAVITMVHGDEVICDNSISFEDMAFKYAQWLQKQK